MKRIAKLRVRTRAGSGLYPPVGLGLYVTRGCTGSTYGEPGQNMFFDLTVLFLVWEWTVSATWKKL